MLNKGVVRRLLLLVIVTSVMAWLAYTLVSPTSNSPRADSLNEARSHLERPSSTVHRRTDMCQSVCKTGTPCQYDQQVDFRIIVITYKRDYSLLKTLSSIHDLDTMGDEIAVEIWIDRLSDNSVDNKTVEVAREFTRQFQKGAACVHVQDQHANIRGQWVNTWRPWPNTREIGLVLEDDIDLSPHAYRWLKAVHRKYKDRDDVTGYTLQMENVQFKSGGQGPMRGPRADTVFMYPVTGTWGFSPHPLRWREFQDWFNTMQHNQTFHPYVPGIISTAWYKTSEKNGISHNVWAMWHHYFNYERHLYCVYSNLVTSTGKHDVLLSANRRERGLHFGKGSNQKVSKMLMQHWKDSYVDLPMATIQFHYNGSIARRV